jgi:hypothetical protein
VNTVLVGLQRGRMIHTDSMWDTLLPLNPRPGYQDMKSSTFLTQPEINKMRELYYIDSFSFDVDWDPETEIEAIIRHRHVRCARRLPGKNTHRSDIAQAFVCLSYSSVEIELGFRWSLPAVTTLETFRNGEMDQGV